MAGCILININEDFEDHFMGYEMGSIEYNPVTGRDKQNPGERSFPQAM